MVGHVVAVVESTARCPLEPAETVWVSFKPGGGPVCCGHPFSSRTKTLRRKSTHPGFFPLRSSHERQTSPQQGENLVVGSFPIWAAISWAGCLLAAETSREEPRTAGSEGKVRICHHGGTLSWGGGGGQQGLATNGIHL